MTRLELVARLIERAGLGEAAARAVVDALFSVEDGIIVDALKEGEQVKITGFGSFDVRSRASRSGRNPHTGASIEIGPTVVAAFRPGRGLKDALLGGTHGAGEGALYGGAGSEEEESPATAARYPETLPYSVGTHGSGEGV